MTNQLHTRTLTPPAFHWPPPLETKWEREYRGFQRPLPHLMPTDRGKYVAIHDERVVGSDCDEMALIVRVLTQIGNVDIHVGLAELFVDDHPIDRQSRLAAAPADPARSCHRPRSALGGKQLQ